MNNLALDPAYADALATYRRELDRWVRDTGASAVWTNGSRSTTTRCTGKKKSGM